MYMKTQELENYLKEKGFNEEKLDTGCNYTKTIGHIELTSYVEPDVEVEFVAVYRWKNNDVKGTYNVSMKQLQLDKESIASLFRKTKNNMPQRIGERVDTHEELENAIRATFE